MDLSFGSQPSSKRPPSKSKRRLYPIAASLKELLKREGYLNQTLINKASGAEPSDAGPAELSVLRTYDILGVVLDILFRRTARCKPRL
jgi:hypothetical protein